MVGLPAGSIRNEGTCKNTVAHGAANRLYPWSRRRATRVVILIFVTVGIEVLAIGFSPTWSIAFAVWYLALFAAGALLNRWCDAPERYAVLVAAFIVVSSSLILMVIAAVSPRATTDPASSAVLVSLWPNVARIAGHPAEAFSV